MFNRFGNLLTFSTFGESHGEGMGVLIDGCPAGLELELAFIRSELDRRRPGASRIASQRKEEDQFQLLSGHVDLVTTGTPIAFWVPNTDARTADYAHLKSSFRPSHADYTYEAKYGIRDHRGGGRASARETLARVIAGAVAKLLLRKAGIRVEAWISAVGDLALPGWPENIAFETPEQEAVRCPDPVLAQAMFGAIDTARKAGDSLGGIVSCRATGLPPGLGEPLYQKLDAVLAAAMLGINAAKGFEMGAGFAGSRMRGSEHNDAIYHDGERIRTRSNHAGGVVGGISNGEELLFRVAFKPTATLMQEQESVDAEGNSLQLKGRGRHDPCVAPRAVPVVEAMAAFVLADFWLLQRTRRL